MSESMIEQSESGGCHGTSENADYHYVRKASVLAVRPGAAGDEASSSCSGESWDAYLDNWRELYVEVENELPQMKIERRRMLAAKKLRLLVQKLDEDLNRTILQMGDEEMERFIAADIEDAATGYLATARKLGKRVPAIPEEDEVKHTTERIRYIERSKAMVGLFNKIVRSHDHQLYRAVHKLTQEQRDRIVRINHEQFSGFHRQKTSGGSASGSGEKTEGQPKRNLNHEFATPRVKSAAKSRKAVALLNSIVDAKDDLLKQAIVSMDRSTRNHLISKNNDFVKFEEQRKKQREKFAMIRKTTTAAEHKFATERVKQVVRAKAASEVFEAILRSKGKRLAGMVKKIPKADKDGFLHQVSGECNNMLQKFNSQAVTLPKKRNGGKKSMLDTARYIRGEIMVLRRRVTEDVHNAIREKDCELEDFVANMDQEQMERTLIDFVPSGMDDLSVWKRDRQKRAWRRLSAFGLVRDDPYLYRQWKQQRHHRARSDSTELAQASKKHEILGSTCAADASRRPPWSTDLHYVRPPPPRQSTATSKAGVGEPHKDTIDRPQTTGGSSTPESDPSEVEEGKTTIDSKANTQSSPRRVVIARARPASAPPVRRGAVARRPVARGTPPAPRRPEPPPASSRSPSLARLARVFYQSSVASTMSGVHQMSEASSGVQNHLCLHRGSTTVTEAQTSKQSSSCLPETQITPKHFPESGHACSEHEQQSGQEGRGSVDTERATNTSSGRGTECHDRNRTAGSRGGREKNGNSSTSRIQRSPPESSGLDTVEERLEEVRLLLAASQLSAEAVTRNIMNGYFERKRAREPNRRKQRKTWISSSRVPQPPGVMKSWHGEIVDGRGRGRPKNRLVVTQSTEQPIIT